MRRAIGATGATYAFKIAIERERPYVGNGSGRSFEGSPSGSNTSFPSQHSAVAWAIAGVVAHEYPGPLSKFAAYALASTVTVTRVTSKQHFASDVVIGGALGWYFAHEVYRARHDPELGGGAWGNFDESSEEPKTRNPWNLSSPYVPPDSWVYPMFDRLAALGLIKTGYAGIRPWTRMESLVYWKKPMMRFAQKKPVAAKMQRSIANWLESFMMNSEEWKANRTSGPAWILLCTQRPTLRARP